MKVGKIYKYFDTQYRIVQLASGKYAYQYREDYWWNRLFCKWELGGGEYETYEEVERELSEKEKRNIEYYERRRVIKIF